MRPGLLVEGETMARNVRETDTQAGVERRCFTCRERGHTLLDSESVSRCRSVLFHRTSVPKRFPGSHRATRARSRTPRRRRAGPKHLAPRDNASRGVRQPPTRNHTLSVDRVKRQAGICPRASRSPRRVPRQPWVVRPFHLAESSLAHQIHRPRVRPPRACMVADAWWATGMADR